MRKFFVFLLFVIPYLTWSNDFSGWKEISTDHYRFIYEEKDELTAFELSEYSEEIYSLVCSFFDYYPDKINVYINGNIDSPNGAFYPLPGSIYLYPVFPFNSENTTKGRSWLFEILLHEMVHYVNLENPIGFFGILSHLFGKDLSAANGAFLPAWMVEGIAVYLETEYSKGGRGRNKYFEAYNKASAVEQTYFSIYQLAYSSGFPPYNRIYSGGYLLLDYLINNYGEEIFQKIYRSYVKFPFAGPFGAIKRETGKDIKVIFEELKVSEQLKYASLKSIIERYPSKKLSLSSYGDWTHPVRTDKGLIVYRTDQQKKSAIVLFDEENQSEEILVEVNLLNSSSFNADSTGETLIFSKGDYTAYHMYGYSYKANLFLLENKKIQRLTSGESLIQPAISPDGKSIVAVQRTGSYSRLVSLDKNNGNISTLFEKEQTNIMNPMFSPSGKKLTFTLNDHGFQNIYVMNFKESGTARTIDTIEQSSEYYSRFISENEISFISDRDGDLSMYRYNIETGELLLAFKDPVGVMDGYIDGDKVYYNSYRTMGNELRSGYLSTGTPITITQTNQTRPLTDISILKSKTYMDWTFPYLWLPKPDILISSGEGVQWGVGMALFAGSYAQSGEGYVELNYLPGLNQINGDIKYTQKLGTTTFSYDFLQIYDEISGTNDYYWEQKTDQIASLVFPFFEKNYLNWRNVLQGYFSFHYSHQRFDNSSFSFSQSFDKEDTNYIYSGTGLVFNGYSTDYPGKSLFGDLSLYNQTDFTVLLPLLSASETVYIIKDSAAVKIPLGPEGFLLQTGLTGAYHSNEYSSSTVSARGWSSSVRTSDISLLYNLDYMIPIALVDWGMPFGFNIQNIGMTVHFEGLSHFTFGGIVENELFSGFELIGTYGYNYGSIPIGAGLNIKVYNRGENFNPSEDIKAYFFLSFNSLY